MSKWSLKRNKQLGIIYHEQTGFVVKSEKPEEKRIVIGVLDEEDGQKIVRSLTDDDVKRITESEFGLTYEREESESEEEEEKEHEEVVVVEPPPPQPEVEAPPPPSKEEEAPPTSSLKEVDEQPPPPPQPESKHTDFVKVSRDFSTLPDQVLNLLQSYTALQEDNEALRAELAQTKAQLQTLEGKFKALKQLFN